VVRVLLDELHEQLVDAGLAEVRVGGDVVFGDQGCLFVCVCVCVSCVRGKRERDTRTKPHTTTTTTTYLD
jgi:hypothetical protein